MAKRIESLGELRMAQGRKPRRRPLDVRVAFVLQAALLEAARQSPQNLQARCGGMGTNGRLLCDKD